MPTDLPIRRPAPPASTRAGNVFLAVAVLAMLAISAIMAFYPDALPTIQM